MQSSILHPDNRNRLRLCTVRVDMCKKSCPGSILQVLGLLNLFIFNTLFMALHHRLFFCHIIKRCQVQFCKFLVLGEFL